MAISATTQRHQDAKKGIAIRILPLWASAPLRLCVKYSGPIAASVAVLLNHIRRACGVGICSYRLRT